MKNLKNILTNVGSIVIGVLLYVFLALPYANVSIPSGFGTINSSASGYDMISDGFGKGADGKSVMLALSNIFIAILAAVIILIAVYKLLVALNVLKTNKLTKSLNIAYLVSTILVLVFSVIAIGCNGGLCADLNVVVNVASIGWACILNLILSAVLTAIALLDFILTRKNK